MDVCWSAVVRGCRSMSGAAANVLQAIVLLALPRGIHLRRGATGRGHVDVTPARDSSCRTCNLPATVALPTILSCLAGSHWRKASGCPTRACCLRRPSGCCSGSWSSSRARRAPMPPLGRWQRLADGRLMAGSWRILSNCAGWAGPSADCYLHSVCPSTMHGPLLSEAARAAQGHLFQGKMSTLWCQNRNNLQGRGNKRLSAAIVHSVGWGLASNGLVLAGKKGGWHRGMVWYK